MSGRGADPPAEVRRGEPARCRSLPARIPRADVDVCTASNHVPPRVTGIRAYLLAAIGARGTVWLGRFGSAGPGGSASELRGSGNAGEVQAGRRAGRVAVVAR